MKDCRCDPEYAIWREFPILPKLQVCYINNNHNRNIYNIKDMEFWELWELLGELLEGI
jgi:hypothetical protein